MTDLKELYRLIKQFEGCRLKPYLCPAGVWTCGWGSTGQDVIPGRTWTQEYADRRMEADAEKFAKGTLSLCSQLAGKDLCAIADFAYNLGVKALEGSTLLKKLNAGDFAGAAAEFPKWNKAGGKVLPGLVKRREAERTLFLA